MTGVDIIGALLYGDAAVVAKVPTSRIKAAALSDGVALPALLIRLVSSVERQNLKRSATTRSIDRISVTVRAANYVDQTDIIKLVRACCAGKFGGASAISITTAGTGPDILGPAASFEQSQDFRVSYDSSESGVGLALPGGMSVDDSSPFESFPIAP